MRSIAKINWMVRKSKITKIILSVDIFCEWQYCRPEGENGTSDKEEEDNLTIAISRDMARALVQIARGIEPKYMQPPLGKCFLLTVFKLSCINLYTFMYIPNSGLCSWHYFDIKCKSYIFWELLPRFCKDSLLFTRALYCGPCRETNRFAIRQSNTQIDLRTFAT